MNRLRHLVASGCRDIGGDVVRGPGVLAEVGRYGQLLVWVDDAEPNFSGESTKRIATGC
jgi:hypothetical protein